MTRTTLVDAFDPRCPIRNILARFSEKWGLLVIYILTLHDKARFSDIRKEIPDISARMLSATLNTLVVDGLVERQKFNTVPPRVEYSLSPIGLSLIPYFEAMVGWAKENADVIMEHRLRAETGKTGISGNGQ